MTEKEDIYKGIWRIPEYDQELHGELSVTDNGIHLYITDPNFRSLPHSNDPDKVNVIQGKGQDGEWISLFNCIGFSGSYEGEIVAISYDRLYDSINQLDFEVIQVVIPAFDEWFDLNSFSIARDETGFDVKYNKPPIITCPLNECLSLEIDFICYPPSTWGIDEIKSIKIQELTYLSIVNIGEKKYSIHEKFEIIAALQSFISFMHRDGCNIHYIKGIHAQTSYRANIHSGTSIYGLHKYNKHTYSSPRKSYIIKYSRISDDFPNVMKKWIELYLKLPQVISLLQQDYFYKGEFDANRFLNLARVFRNLSF
jgi:hypothetical protein